MVEYMQNVFRQCFRVLNFKFDVFGFSISFYNLMMFGVACTVLIWIVRKIYS